MTTRLYCRECGWHPKFRRKRAALRAAARHHCPGTPLADTAPCWFTRLWTTLWTRRRRDTPGTVHATAESTAPADTTELRDVRGNRIQRAVLAAHHAETTRRSRQAMIDLVRAGYQLGPPPYGYLSLRIRVTDHTGHSKLRAVLVPNWQTATVVTQIFTWRADHAMSFTDVAARLNTDLRQYPPPVPNGRWTAKAVRRIVTFSALLGTV